jgi:hypothetical protein
MLDDQKWLEWYSQLQYDKARRNLGLLPRDEGVQGPEDRLDLMIERGLGPPEPVTQSSIRKKLGFPERDDSE